MKKKVAVIMSSQSDYPVMKPAIDYLRKHNITADARVTSAHRTPDLMASFSKTAQRKGYLAIIAGAGGAAHLPGMSASHTMLPVIGIPVTSSQYKGIDSLLSILQMPPGVSVLTVGISQSKIAAQTAAQIVHTTGDIHLCGQTKTKPAMTCKNTLDEFGVDYTSFSKKRPDAINIEFVPHTKKGKQSKELTISCFVAPSANKPTVATLNKSIGTGVAVGINNGVNAAMSAIQVAAITGKYRKDLAKFRRAQQLKALKMDHAVRKK